MAEVTMLKKNDHNGQTRNIERNQKKWHQRIGSDLSIGKRQQIIIRRRQNCIHRRKNVHFKQQEAQRENPTKEP